MKFIALKTCDGGAKGRISFCCKALKVTRQGFHDYLKNRNKPWKHEELTAKMMEILSEDECNDTYGRERMHKALLLKYPDSGIPSEATVYRVMTAIGITHRPNRKPNGNRAVNGRQYESRVMRCNCRKYSVSVSRILRCGTPLRPWEPVHKRFIQSHAERVWSKAKHEQ